MALPTVATLLRRSGPSIAIAIADELTRNSHLPRRPVSAGHPGGISPPCLEPVSIGIARCTGTVVETGVAACRRPREVVDATDRSGLQALFQQFVGTIPVAIEADDCLSRARDDRLAVALKSWRDQLAQPVGAVAFSQSFEVLA